MQKKQIAQLTVIFIGVLLLLNTLFLLVVANFNAGIAVLGTLSLALIGYGIFWYRDKVAKWVHGTAIALCSIVVLFCGFLAFYGNTDNVRYDEDAVVVLGAGVHGEQVSSTLAWRLNKAVEYHLLNPQAVLVVSGGQGPQEDISEALAMERYLIEKGVPAEKIIKEDRATSTYENFLFSAALLEEEFPAGYSAAFITNNFHVYRAERTAQHAGLSARHIGAPVTWYNIPADYIREMMAVTKSWISPPKTASA